MSSFVKSSAQGGNNVPPVLALGDSFSSLPLGFSTVASEVLFYRVTLLPGITASLPN